MCEVARTYTLSEIHSFIQKHAANIGSWLPSEVHTSIADLEKVVSESVTTARPYRPHHDRRQRAPTWQNKNWNNFRNFQPTKVLSHETPASRFRTVFNKLTDASLGDTVTHLKELIAEQPADAVGKTNEELAEVVLKGVVASPGNADLYARYLLACKNQGASTSGLTLTVMDRLRDLCVKRASKAENPKDESYDALCAANKINDTTTAYLRLAVLCERVGVLAVGSTGLLMKKLATRLTKLGAAASDKPAAEVLVARLVSALEALGGPPGADVKAAMDTVLANCGKRSEFPGLGNKVRFTLMDYYDTLEE